MSCRGLLLLAHGSKDPEWLTSLKMIEDFARREFAGPTVLCYLESATPRVEQGVLELVFAGVRHIAVAPLFLAAGSHVKVDIPNLIRAERDRHPGVDFLILPTIGQLPQVQRAISIAIVRSASPHRIPDTDVLIASLQGPFQSPG